MDECLRVLDEEKGYLDDEVLVHQVRLQLVTGEVASMSPSLPSLESHILYH